MKRNDMVSVGLTGGIGSGKSVVAELFRMMGVPVYDSDERAKALYDENADLKAAMVARFGAGLYQGDKLDRAALADLIFKDPSTLQAVNALVHPFVGADFFSWAASLGPVPALVQESAILFEANLADRFDLVVSVTAPEALRIDRVCRRSGCTVEQVRERMSHQLSEEERLNRSDVVLVNDGVKALLPQVVALVDRLKQGI